MNKLTIILLILIMIVISSIIIKNINLHRELYTNSIPIIIYYHIAEIGDWEKIVVEQLSLIKSSGLYDKCKEIRIGFLGNKHNILKFIKNKVKLVYHSNNIKEYEHPTINSLLNFAKKSTQENYILYIHNKGSTKRICNNINGQYYWRQLMNYWMITQYKKCIYYLNKGFLTCGINKNSFNTHYSGNFWWSNTKYISSLSSLPQNDRRTDAENWLLVNKNKNKNKNISISGPYIDSYACSGLYGKKLILSDYMHEDIRIF